MTASNSNSLFQDDDMAGSGAASPWDLPTPRKPQSRSDLLRNILPASDVPDSYIETFDAIVREHGSGGKVTSAGAMRVLAAARLEADAQAKIMSIISPGGGEVSLGRNEFNVLLGLTGLAQEHETVSLDGIDERRRSECISCSSLLYLSLTCLIPVNPISLFITTHVPHTRLSFTYLPHAKRLCTAASPGGGGSLSLIYDRHWQHVDALFARQCCQLAPAPPSPSTCRVSDKATQSSCGADRFPLVRTAPPCFTLHSTYSRSASCMHEILQPVFFPITIRLTNNPILPN